MHNDRIEIYREKFDLLTLDPIHLIIHSFNIRDIRKMCCCLTGPIDRVGLIKFHENLLSEIYYRIINCIIRNERLHTKPAKQHTKPLA